MLAIIPLSVLLGFISFLISYNMNLLVLESSLILSASITACSFVFLTALNFLFNRMSLRSAIGLAVGLATASIVFFAADQLIDIVYIQQDFQPLVKVVTFFLLVAIGITLGVYRPRDSEGNYRTSNSRGRRGTTKILDTSVIIDGRIADVAEAGFIEGDMIIPHFIIKELQYIADSGEAIKRVRGRRGLDVLKKMQNEIPDVVVKVTDHDFPDIREADLKLVELAKKLKGVIITNDFNLNKVADLQNVKVLNLNELSNALKPVVLPGELLRIQLIKEGKEQRQAIGYLDDGTMVVVDDAISYIGRELDVTVTSVLQTPTGRMIFAKINKEDALSSINV